MARSSLIPGFRFHPTDPELVMYYLKRKLLGKKIIVNVIAEVNIYDFSPQDLPDKSLLRNGDLEWYFFCPKAKKYSSGSRSNRATETGFWKATGKDRKVIYKERTVATIKTLVFHRGHAGHGERTDWVMHEYRMEDEQLANAGVVQDMYVICKIFEKSGSGPKNGAQYGAPFNEEEWDDDVASCSGSQAVVGPVGATNKLDYKQKGSAIMSMTEPGSSTVTFSTNEAANTMTYKQKGPATRNMAVPKRTHGVCFTEPGSSSVTFSANERRVDVHASDDVMLLEDLASAMEVSPMDFNGNHENEGVEVVNAEKGKSVAPNEDDFYDELVNFIDLGNLNEVATKNFNTDGADYTLDKILAADDLDADLRGFYVD